MASPFAVSWQDLEGNRNNSTANLYSRNPAYISGDNNHHHHYTGLTNIARHGRAVPDNENSVGQANENIRSWYKCRWLIIAIVIGLILVLIVAVVCTYYFSRK